VFVCAQVKAILVNVFGGIVNCATIANGIVNAAKSINMNVPVVVRLEGPLSVPVLEPLLLYLLVIFIHSFSWWRGSVVSMPVFGWRTYPDLWLICYRLVDKVSAIGQLTMPTQPSNPSGVGKCNYMFNGSGDYWVETIKRQTGLRMAVWL